MACTAARRIALTRLPGLRVLQAPTAADVWRSINWWTPETIVEALAELEEAGAVKSHVDGLGKRRFRRIDSALSVR